MTAHVVYTFRDADGTVLYVGCTSDPVSRFEQHRLDKEWFRQVATIECEHHDDGAEAFRREREVIRALNPVHASGGRAGSVTGWPRCAYDHHCGKPAEWAYRSEMNIVGREDGRADRLVCDYHLRTRLNRPGRQPHSYWRLSDLEREVSA